MFAKKHPKEKILYILKKPIEELIEFIDKISDNYKKKLLKKLPPIKGFRNTSLTGFQTRLKNMINLAKKDEYNYSFQHLFIEDIWIRWIDSNIKLKEVLLQFNNENDFQNEEEIIPPNSFLDIECFYFLRLEIENKSISIEDVKQFYEFGYFIKDPLIDMIINNDFENNEDVRKVQDKYFIELMNHYFRYKTSIAKSMDKINETLKNTNGKVSELSAQNDKLTEHINKQSDANLYQDKEESEKTNELKDIIDKQQNKIQAVFECQKSFQQKLEHYITQDKLKKSIQEICTQISNIKNDISSNNKNQLSDISNSFDNQINSISQHIETLEQMMISMENDLMTKNSVKQEIEQMMEGINDELNAIKLSSGSSTSSNEKISLIHVAKVTNDKELKTIDNFKELNKCMTDNFKAIGLIKKNASNLAYEIIAGLGTGSLIMFSGSLSNYLAKICVSTIAAKNNTPILHIPIGLLDGREFYRKLNNCLNEARDSDHLTALIFEGINHSAFECYGQSLREMIISRLLDNNNTNNNIAFFATLAKGMTTLPISKELCELGPVFDTDFLGWGTNSNIDNFVPSTILTQNWINWVFSLNNDLIPDELESLFSEMNDISQVWKICLRKTFKMLTCNEPLNSIGFGWLMQRALADERNKKRLIDFCDENIEDDRIKKMIKKST